MAIIAYAVVYVLSERVLARTYEYPASKVSVPTDSASIAEGQRSAIVHGCFGGCHGKQVEGAVMFDERPLGRIGLTVGKFKTVPQLIAETVPPPDATSEAGQRGRYLARTTCSQCHGTSLRGDSNPDFTSPSLLLVGAYSPESFTQLMRSGVALGGRKLDTMSPWAQQHLSHLTDSEIADLHSYLHTMP